MESPVDGDIILVDSEGSGNIKQMTQNLRLGGLVMQSITTGIIYKSPRFVAMETYKEIRSYLVMAKLFGGRDDYLNSIIISSDIGKML